MRSVRILCSVLLLLAPFMFSFSARAATEHPDWTTPLAPFRIADHLYYVGSRDLASFLLTTTSGDILVNSNLQSSVPQIRASVEQLGFHWRDIRILLISHAHSDHAAGSAAILKQTGAKFMVMDGDVDVMQTGGRSDFAYGPQPQFPPAHVDRVLHDGDTVSLGGVTLTAHRTPGHTRGCTTWTMNTTATHGPGQPNGPIEHVVIVGSWNVNGYRLVASHGKPASYPGIVTDFEHTFAVLQSMPCDIFLGAHGQYFGMLPKLARLPAQGERVWIDPEGYRRAVSERQGAFLAELHRQQAAASKH